MVDPASSDSRARLALPALVLAVLLQSTGPIIVKDATAPGLTFAFHRLWVAAVVMVVISTAAGAPLDRRVLKASFLGGLLFALNLALFFSAVNNTSIANAAVLTSTHPLLMMLITKRLFGERTALSDVALAGTAVAGVGLVVFGADQASTGNIDGDLLALAAMVTFGGYLAASKRARVELDALSYQAGYTAIATVLILPILLASGQELGIRDGTDWWLIVAMAILPGGGHYLINFAHPHVRLVVLSLMLLFVVPGATIIAWLWLDESLAALQVVGIVVVLAAVATVILRSSPPPAPGQSGDAAIAEGTGL